MGHIVHLRGTQVLLGSYPAITRVDFDVDAGQIVALWGPNGAGKSTLLRAIAGLVPVQASTAKVCDIDLTRNRGKVRHKVAYLGHEPGLYNSLTVNEQLELVGKARGNSTASASDAMVLAQLPKRVGQTRCSHLSSGQRRRVGLACLWMTGAPLWLLDEPHAGLDSGGHAMLDDLLTAARANNTTIVAATHETAWPTAIGGVRQHIAGGELTAADWTSQHEVRRA